MGRLSEMISDLRAETHKVSGMSGTYADFVYQGEQLFLEAVAKIIKRIAGGHAKSIRVTKDRGRTPFLQYEGEDRSDIGMVFTLHLLASSPNDVVLSWFGKSDMTGRFNGKRKFAWGQLTPDEAATPFREVFG